MFCHISMHVCSAPTGFKGGSLGCHAPCAGASAFGHHNGKLIQGVGLQSCHNMVQAGCVGNLWTGEQDTFVFKSDRLHNIPSFWASMSNIFIMLCYTYNVVQWLPGLLLCSVIKAFGCMC